MSSPCRKRGDPTFRRAVGKILLVRLSNKKPLNSRLIEVA